MEPHQTVKTAPRLSVRLWVDPVLARVVAVGDPLNEALHKALLQELSELLETLGIPGEPVVTITALQRSLPSGRFMRIDVEDQQLRYSDETLSSVYCWLNGSIFRADVTPPAILAWLQRMSESGESASDHQAVATLLTQMTLAIVKAQPSVLLGPSQLQAYLEFLPNPSVESKRWPPDQAWLLPILRVILNLRISIADKQIAADTLAQSTSKSWQGACEDLIDALRPDAIEIHLQQEFMRALTTTDADNRVGMFAFLRDGLFAELGVVYPPFRLVPDSGLLPKQFMFKLNHLTCVPQVGLGPEECLVNDTPERLKQLPLEIRADPAGNPATGHPNSVTNLKHKNDLESRSLTIWDDMGYLILSLAAALRRNSGCFVQLRFAEAQLKQLGRVFPALIKTAGSTVSPGQITAVLRALVAEELSVGNLRLILERLTDYELCNDADGHNVLDDTPTAFEPGNAASGDDLTRLTAFVRRGMKRQISGKFSRETNTIDAYLLDLDIEGFLSRSGSVEVDGQRNANPNTEQQDDILESIRREIAQLPPTAQIPLILTTHNLRGPLKKAIAQEFPRIHVVAFQELMPDLNVRPIARISSGFGDAVK
jgi:hypothetical protein